MRARVQSFHFLNDEQLVAIWRRSAFDETYRDCLEKIAPPNNIDGGEEKEEDEVNKNGPQQKTAQAKEWLKYWLKQGGKSDLGQLDGSYCFWANWIETNRGLVPVLDPDVFGQPHGWRLVLEDGRVLLVGESFIDDAKRFSLVILNGQPMVIGEKISEEEKRRVFDEARAQLNELSARLRKPAKKEEE